MSASIVVWAATACPTVIANSGLGAEMVSFSVIRVPASVGAKTTWLSSFT